MIVCVCLIARQGDAVLSVRVRDNALWYLPGGKIEAGETPEQALVREVGEELSLALDPASLRYEFTVTGPAYPQDGDVELRCYSGRWSGDVVRAAEISEVAWLGRDQVQLFTPTIRKLYEQHVAPPAPQQPPVIYLNDHLGAPGCACSATCRNLVGAFRMGTGRYRRMKRVFVASTPGELKEFAPEIIKDQRHALAVFDLEAYGDMAAVMDAAKIITEKRGRVNREVARAKRLGYYAKTFSFAEFVPDVVAIHGSKQVRNHRPLHGAYYFRTAADFGGAPTARVPVAPLECPHHHAIYWGVFKRVEGYRQGELQTDEQLVAYVRLRRHGDYMSYTAIMGHGDHLPHGVMYLMHYDLVEKLLPLKAPERPRYIIYQHYTAGAGDTLGTWKQRCLFKPFYLHYVDERPVRFPLGQQPPEMGVGLLAVKGAAGLPMSAAMRGAEQAGVTRNWMKLLLQMDVIERSRAPGLIAGVLRAGAHPGLAALRPLASGLFPLDAISDRAPVTVLLQGPHRGLDSLLQMFDAGMKNVAVHHVRTDSAEELKALYDPAWRYGSLAEAAPHGPAGAVVAECPTQDAAAFLEAQLEPLTRAFAGRLVLGFDDPSLASLGCSLDQATVLYNKDKGSEAPFAAMLSRLLKRPVRIIELYYRGAEQFDTYWLSLDLDPPAR